MINGIIIINKEKEYTSNDVVRIVKKITKTKVGHTGTLDPNATGVLPLLLGEGTKVSKYLINHNKEYEAVLQLGKKTETADGEGIVIEEKEVLQQMLKKEFVEETLNSFIGVQNQVPPMYSAIKVNGRKLYDYARSGQTVEVKARRIEIYNIKLIKIDEKEKQIFFRVSCSKGTYIRTLCENIAEKLGTVGYMKELNRTKVGDFKIEDSIKVKELEENILKNNLSKIITIEELFKEKEKVELTDNEIKKYLNGVQIPINEIYSKTNNNDNEEICRVYYKNKFIGLGVIKNEKLKRDIVIQ
jgi:tRNA pseudouridine synthase B